MIKKLIEQLVTDEIPLSSALKQSKIIFHNTKDVELGLLLENELNGYKAPIEVPDYRMVFSNPKGKYIDRMTGERVLRPFNISLSDKLRKKGVTDSIHNRRILISIPEIESLLSQRKDDKDGEIQELYPPELLDWQRKNSKNNSSWFLESAHWTIQFSTLSNILTRTQTKLIDILLRLSNEHPSAEQDLIVIDKQKTNKHNQNNSGVLGKEIEILQNAESQALRWNAKKESTYAVIIAIENYRFSNNGQGISSVKYAENDATEFKELLTRNFGVLEENMLVWIDADATKSALEHELPYFIRQLPSEARFIFYFAGHGFYNNDSNRFTVWDSHIGNLFGTSVSIDDVLLSPLLKSDCNESLIFLDACSTYISDIADSRDLVSSMSPVEFENFVSNTKYSAIFSSCTPGEKSYPDDKLNHGIWTWHLLQALKGNVPEAIVMDEFITDISLRDYLKKSVPEYITKNTTIKNIQIPWAKIHSSNTFIIQKVTPARLEKRADSEYYISKANHQTFKNDSKRYIIPLRKNFVCPLDIDLTSNIFSEIADLRSANKTYEIEFQIENLSTHYSEFQRLNEISNLSIDEAKKKNTLRDYLNVVFFRRKGNLYDQLNCCVNLIIDYYHVRHKYLATLSELSMAILCCFEFFASDSDQRQKGTIGFYINYKDKWGFTIDLSREEVDKLHTIFKTKDDFILTTMAGLDTWDLSAKTRREKVIPKQVFYFTNLLLNGMITEDAKEEFFNLGAWKIGIS